MNMVNTMNVGCEGMMNIVMLTLFKVIKIHNKYQILLLAVWYQTIKLFNQKWHNPSIDETSTFWEQGIAAMVPVTWHDKKMLFWCSLAMTTTASQLHPTYKQHNVLSRILLITFLEIFSKIFFLKLCHKVSPRKKFVLWQVADDNCRWTKLRLLCLLWVIPSQLGGEQVVVDCKYKWPILLDHIWGYPCSH